jgi:peroxiredoxin (alkyl hydroperoxide reductase subunit C)
MKEMKVGCGKPTGTVVGETKKEEVTIEETEKRKEFAMTTVKIGTKAPAFEAPAFHNGRRGRTFSHGVGFGG